MKIFKTLFVFFPICVFQVAATPPYEMRSLSAKRAPCFLLLASYSSSVLSVSSL